MPHKPTSKPKAPTVPREQPTEDRTPEARRFVPSPDQVNARDEDYATQDQPLDRDAEAARALQDRPPRGTDQLRTGTAGDSARPTKEGIHDKPIPPRGRM